MVTEYIELSARESTCELRLCMLTCKSVTAVFIRTGGGKGGQDFAVTHKECIASQYSKLTD